MSMRIRAALAAASVAVAVGLAGCTAAPAADLTAGQAEAFRSRVVAIADTSARGEYANALAAVEALEAELEQAVAEGELDGGREQRIRDAIALVRADLEAAIAAIPPEPEPEPAPAPAPAPEDDDGDDDDDSGRGNSDEGKGKGKGKDKD
ncbi:MULTISPECIES: hypothetical protein [unclassified Agromyces]|uniref:hypothetical protein n=1 Tax=unclassified Agromyces TaxID=2639701 RepID=UPI003014C73E